MKILTQESDSLPAERVSSVADGKEQNETTMMTQDPIRAEFIGLRTVPVILKNRDRSMKVNALLDDASTKTYATMHWKK